VHLPHAVDCQSAPIEGHQLPAAVPHQYLLPKGTQGREVGVGQLDTKLLL
jgi:hypothetical protein